MLSRLLAFLQKGLDIMIVSLNLNDAPNVNPKNARYG
jgi:hypothetical protein